MSTDRTMYSCYVEYSGPNIFRDLVEAFVVSLYFCAVVLAVLVAAAIRAATPDGAGSWTMR